MKPPLNTVRPVRPVVKPMVLTPFDGLMACARKLTGVIEQRTGFDLWDGADGLSGVAADILRGFKVPEEVALSPRVVAERCGLVSKRRSPKRRLK